jgi:hypothetical protein
MNNDRGIKDEAFVRKALDIATFDDGRWIANQGQFNRKDSDTLEASVQAALVTSASIYVQKEKLEESSIAEALNIKTVGDARKFIDKYHDKIAKDLKI